MTSEYVVEVEVSGFVVEGMVDVDGGRLTRKQAKKANEAKLAYLEGTPEVHLVDVLQREDGTGILWFRWDPPTESDDDGVPLDDGAATWLEAKHYTETALSVVGGAGLQLVEKRIVTRDLAEPSPAAPEPS